MSLETDVQELTQATTDLLVAVNVSKATLDGKVEDAGDFATASLNSANASAASAATATTQATAAGTARTGAETARDAAVVAQNNAVAVVTGGTATLTPSATKIPLSDAQGKIAKGWLTNTDLVEQTDIGTAPNEIPLNQFLGELAYLDAQNIPTLGINVANANTANVTNLMQVTEISNAVPSLNLDFAKVKQLDPRITFTRASTGTYYDGKTMAKAEENLLTFSEQFDNAVWTKGNATVTANTSVAPDGTTTADKLVENTATAEHRVLVSLTLSTAAFTASTYFKAAERSFAFIRLDDPVSSKYAYFNLATGTIGDVTSGLTAFIENIGNGWYRCAARFNTPAAGSGSVVFASTTANGTNSYTGDGTSGIFIWGAQLEQRALATAYTPTTTQPVTNYIPVLQTAAAGVPRFEHNPVTGESLGLEIEEQRTNLVTYSSDFDNAAWTKTRATITANAIAAPDGTVTADKLVENTDTNSHFINQNATVSSGIAITYSIYAKKGERNYLSIFCLGTTAASNTFFDLNTGVVVSTSANATSSIQNIGNGWYRCTVTATTNATTTGLYPGISADGVNASYTGNGFSGIYIWGAQLEAGAFPTSYIPTVASQVTRAADSASMTGANFSSWYRQGQGTLFADFVSITPTLSGVFNFQDSAGSNAIGINTNALGSNTVRMSVDFNGSTQYSNSATATTNSNIKTAFAYATNNFASAVNGGAVNSSSSGTVPSASLTAYIGDIRASFSKPLNGTIKKITYYPQRLSNAELVEMTA